MCRLIAYIGHDLLLQDVLVNPVNSIIMQSLHARESEVPTNGDGFGVGWYSPSIDQTPALFTSIFPAWNDRNLLNLTAKIKSPAFFSHVRAASAGGVSNYNCHPFVHKNWMMMHNGTVNDFIKLKRHIRHLLEDDVYFGVQGETDSEHLFALFQQLSKGKRLDSLIEVADIMELVLQTVNNLQDQYGNGEISYFNICLTDGKRLLATRYCTEGEPASLHYAQGSQFLKRDDGRYHMLQQDGGKNCVLVASEKLNDFDMEWKDVPKNHFLLVDEQFNIVTRPINL